MTPRADFPSNATPPSTHPLPTLPALFKQHDGSGKWVVYCGAGISIPSPSAVPSWKDLATEILSTFYGTRVDKAWLPRDMKEVSLDQPPEIVFETFGSILGPRFLEVFQALDAGKPNDNHVALAALAKLGKLKAIWTTNFDSFVERALEAAGVKFRVLVENADYDDYFSSASASKTKSDELVVCKIHGTTTLPHTIVAVASAYKSSKGFAASKARVFAEHLETSPCMFLGYSGWDFLHDHYQAFWDSVGGSVKQIVYNVRPSDTAFPAFETIFRSAANVAFAASELPQGLVEITAIAPQPAPADAWTTLKASRVSFFEKWAKALPLTHCLVLAVTTAMQFSEGLRAARDAGKELTEGKSIEDHMDQTKAMTELANDMSAGKITMEQYMEKMQDMTLRAQLVGIPPRHHDKVLGFCKSNAIPGQTDDPFVGRSMFVSRLSVFTTAGLDPDEALVRCREWYDKYDSKAKTLAENSPEKQAWTMFCSYLAGFGSKDAELSETYIAKLAELRDKCIAGSITLDAFGGQATPLMMEFSRAKMGMIAKMEQAIRTMVAEAAKHINDEEQLAVLSTALLGSWSMWFSTEVGQWPEAKDLLIRFNRPPLEGEKPVTISDLAPVDKRLRDVYAPLITAVAKGTPFQRGCVELIMVKQMLAAFPNTVIDWNGKDSLSGGYYMQLSVPNPILAEHVRRVLEMGVGAGAGAAASSGGGAKPSSSGGGVMGLVRRMSRLGAGAKPASAASAATAATAAANNLLEAVVNAYPKYPTLAQNACGVGCKVAEVCKDADLALDMAERSLAISEGRLTEATPAGIPSSAATLLEMAGGRDAEALRLYKLACGAAVLAIPLNVDAEMYRSVLLISRAPDLSPAQRRDEVVSLLGKFHPKYNQHLRPPGMAYPARRLALEEAEKVVAAASRGKSLDEEVKAISVRA